MESRWLGTESPQFEDDSFDPRVTVDQIYHILQLFEADL
jgi:hypothetical protein